MKKVPSGSTVLKQKLTYTFSTQMKTLAAGNKWIQTAGPGGGGGGEGGGIEEAPINGKQYAREDGGWTEITANDGDYLRIDSGAGDQTVESTDTTTFKGITEHEGGVRVTGGDRDEIGLGIVSDEDNLSLMSGAARIRIGRDTGTVFNSNSTGNTRFQVSGSYEPADATTNGTGYAFFRGIRDEFTCANFIGFSSSVDSRTGSNGTITGDACGYTAAASWGDKGSRSIGYRSLLNSGSNNFNFLAEGTADNFFNGNILVNGTPDNPGGAIYTRSSGTQLVVTGDGSSNGGVFGNRRINDDGEFVNARPLLWTGTQSVNSPLLQVNTATSSASIAGVAAGYWTADNSNGPSFTLAKSRSGQTGLHTDKDGNPVVLEAGDTIGNIKFLGGHLERFRQAADITSIVRNPDGIDFTEPGLSWYPSDIRFRVGNPGGTGTNSFTFLSTGDAEFGGGLKTALTIESGGGVRVKGGNEVGVDTGLYYRNGSAELGLARQGVAQATFEPDRARRFLPDKIGLSIGWQAWGKLTQAATDARGFSSYFESSTEVIPELTHFAANQSSSVSAETVKGFVAENGLVNGTTASYGFYSNIPESTGPANFNFFADNDAPNFFQGDTSIGGTADAPRIELLKDGSAKFSGQVTLPGGGGATQALQKQEIETLIANSGGGGDGTGTVYKAGTGLSLSSDTFNLSAQLQCSQTGGNDNNPAIKLNPTDGAAKQVKIVGGSNCTVTRDNNTQLTIDTIDTTYDAGEGLELINNEFSLRDKYLPVREDIRSVLEFGARGDGASDKASMDAEFAAVQAALDWLASDGNGAAFNKGSRCLYFPAGEYRVNASLVLDPINPDNGEIRNDITIKGDGSATLIKGFHNGTVLDINPRGIELTKQLVNLNLLDFKVATAKRDADESTSIGIRIRKSYALTLRNVDVVLSARNIVLENSIRGMLSNFECRQNTNQTPAGSGNALIEVRGGAGLHITDFEGMGPDSDSRVPPDYGIFVEDIDGLYLNNCHWYWCKTSLRVQPTTDVPFVTSIMLSNCYFDSARYRHVEFFGNGTQPGNSTLYGDIMFSNCFFRNCADHSVVFHLTPDTDAETGDELEPTRRFRQVMFDNCEFKRIGQTAIAHTSAAPTLEDISITNCHFVSCDYENSNYPILINEQCDSILMTNNVITATQTTQPPVNLPYEALALLKPVGTGHITIKDNSMIASCKKGIKFLDPGRSIKFTDVSIDQADATLDGTGLVKRKGSNINDVGTKDLASIEFPSGSLAYVRLAICGAPQDNATQGTHIECLEFSAATHGTTGNVGLQKTPVKTYEHKGSALQNNSVVIDRSTANTINIQINNQSGAPAKYTYTIETMYLR